MNYLLPLISVLLGYGIAIFIKPQNKNNIKLLLAFSGSFLLSITLIHLLPEVYESKTKNIGLFKPALMKNVVRIIAIGK